MGDNGRKRAITEKPAWAQTRPGLAVLVFTHKTGRWIGAKGAMSEREA